MAGGTATLTTPGPLSRRAKYVVAFTNGAAALANKARWHAPPNGVLAA